MKTTQKHLTIELITSALLCLATVVPAATNYVWQGSPSPGPPFTNWATAAHTIQEAVDAASTGDTVLVTNGVYATGGKAMAGTMTNRVAVYKPLTLRSVNGPEFTVIRGYQLPGTNNGDGAIRCAYLTNGANLSGFTLTNGATGSAGDAFMEQSGGGVWCESTNALVTNCTLAGNSAASRSGGAFDGTLNSCTLTGNSAGSAGGGAYQSTLRNCTLVGNSGGGAYQSTLYNCTLTGNSAYAGGGACQSTLYSCTLTGNSAEYGGGTYAQSTLYNCTLTGNSAKRGGGGAADSSTLYNCILYYNTAPSGPNYYGCTFAYSCTTPLPPGEGNTAAEPQLASTTHLSSSSPCVAAGSSAYARGMDIDGDPWLDPPCMGADQVVPGQVTGLLTVGIESALYAVLPGSNANFRAQILGRPTASVWDFGDGVVVSNQPCMAHIWSTPGLYWVRLTAYNEDLPGGVATSLPVRVYEPSQDYVLYVNPGNPTPTPPYLTWETAATHIQNALRAAVELGGRLVIVTNGIYRPGQQLDISPGITLLSVNGPAVTVIDGDASNRCAYVRGNAILSGFTLTNGLVAGWDGSDVGGGGAYCEPSAILTNCLLVKNTACLVNWEYGIPSGAGGGAHGGILRNCTLAGNSANRSGGGAAGAVLLNCTLSGNSASYGGGVHHSTLYNCTLTANLALYGGGGADWSTLYNCIVYYNTAPNGSNHSQSTFAYSCTTPLPLGEGNIEEDPQLLPDHHLAAGSPCIAAGSSVYASGVDMDGDPWLDPPCMGADEYSLWNHTGPFRICISANCTITGPGWPLGLGAQIEGRFTSLSWDFGDGVVVSNRGPVSHTWSAPGTYLVSLTAWNDSRPSGVTATTLVHVLPVVQCVSASSVSPQPPYTNWATAAATIQDAVDAAAPGAVVLVTNGLYSSGGVGVSGQSNRVSLSKPLTVLSLHGPTVTTISGDAVTRCVFLGAAATLSGFTLANGHADYGGGVIDRSTDGKVTNCVLVGNRAVAGGGACYAALLNCVLRENRATDTGGAAFGGILRNCLLVNNAAANWGGGADYGTLVHCTVASNSASWGGGVCESALQNCIVYDNTGVDDPNHAASSIDYSCTVPLPPGEGNITNAPAFLSSAVGDFRLCASSGCIDGGRDLGGLIGTDLLGYPRPLDGNGDGIAAFDMGAYEYSGPPADANADGIPDGWCCRHGLDPMDAAVGGADPDQDGHTTLQEWAADTDPKNAASCLRVCGFSPGPSRGILVLSSPNRRYTLQSCTELVAPVWTAVPGATDIAGTGGLLTLTDPAPGVPRFYRVSVRMP